MKDKLKCVFISANENRYEGSWKDDKKNGPGKYYYLTHGQIYEGVWNDDIAKCGTMKDFSRDSAPEPTVYPIPKVSSLKILKFRHPKHCCNYPKI